METLEFEELVADALREIPVHFRNKISNVAFVVETHGRQIARGERPIRAGGILLGLYQGVPLGRRGPNYSGVLPDKITIFQDAIEFVAGNEPEAIRRIVRQTVHHEVAHFFGMNEAEVRRWEANRPSPKTR